MIEIIVGVVLTLTALIFAIAWFNVIIIKDSARAEAEAEALRLAREKRDAADAIMRENVADDLVWRQRFSQRLRDQDDS